MLLLALLALVARDDVLAQAPLTDDQDPRSEQRRVADNGQRCWRSAPQPETVEEALIVAKNQARHERQQRAGQRGAGREVLFLSSGALKSAYGAGLLVGWGETGNRPRFAAVTAVGVSALIAPFVFIGPAGDQVVADIFNCSTSHLAGLAERAVAYLDYETLAAIAREHEAGRRLLVALPGSPARPEVIWDIGRLAATPHPSAAVFVGKVLLAALDGHSFVDPKDAPAAAGQIVERNVTFRALGAGEQFLFPLEVAQIASRGMRYYLIHNERIFPDESADYIRARSSKDDLHPHARAVVPAYNIVRHSLANSSSFRFASIKLRLGLAPQAQFDMAYLKTLFRYAYRQGRMGEEWKSTFPGLPPVAAQQSR